jgi:hypothetical protein
VCMVSAIRFMTYDLMYLQLRISCASHERKETVIISDRVR